MKNMIWVAALLLAATTLNAQVCGEKGIATDPLNSYPNGRASPVNPENPGIINRFNWRLNPLIDGVNFRFTPVNGTTKYLLSPWHVATDPNVQYSDLAKGVNSDYKPADGWEVFKVNLGRLADDVTPRFRAPVVPYIMLYNRYTGLLRVFAYLDRTNDYNSISIKLSIVDPGSSSNLNYSAILGLHGEIQQALDRPVNVTSVKSVSKYYNNQSMFFWADFPLAYDVCICSYASHMKVEFSAITSGTINMKGTIVGQVVPVVTQSNNPIAGIQNAVASILTVGKAVANMSYLNIYNAFQSILGITNVDPGISKALNTFNNMIKAGQTLDQLKSSDYDSVAKALSAINNYFGSVSKSGITGASVLTATAELSGSLTMAQEFGNSTISFATPGSKGSQDNPEENINNDTDPLGNVRPEYVIYNEIPGTFALLNTPVVQVAYNGVGETPPGGYRDYGYIGHQQLRFALNRTVPLQPKFPLAGSRNNDVLYALNPIMHANTAKTKIKVALVARVKMGSEATGHMPLYTGLSNNYPLINLSPVMGSYPNMLEKVTCGSYSGNPNEIDWCVRESIIGDNYTWKPDTYEFISPLVPIEYIYDLQGELSLYGSNGSEQDVYGVGDFQGFEDIRLKFFVDFESNDIGSNGSPNKSTLVFTYPLELMVMAALPTPVPVNLSQTRTPLPPVTTTAINQFCNVMPAYRANQKLQAKTANTVTLTTAYSAKVAAAEEVQVMTKKNNELNVFPNPATDFVNVDYKIDRASDITIQVVNMAQQEVKSVKFANQLKGQHRELIKLGTLAPGTYILKVHSNTKVVSSRFVIIN